MSIIALNILAIGGVVLMWIAYRLFDVLTPGVDYPQAERLHFMFAAYNAGEGETLGYVRTIDANRLTMQTGRK